MGSCSSTPYSPASPESRGRDGQLVRAATQGKQLQRDISKSQLLPRASTEQQLPPHASSAASGRSRRLSDTMWEVSLWSGRRNSFTSISLPRTSPISTSPRSTSTTIAAQPNFTRMGSGGWHDMYAAPRETPLDTSLLWKVIALETDAPTGAPARAWREITLG